MAIDPSRTALRNIDPRLFRPLKVLKINGVAVAPNERDSITPN